MHPESPAHLPDDAGQLRTVKHCSFAYTIDIVMIQSRVENRQSFPFKQTACMPFFVFDAQVSGELVLVVVVRLSYRGRGAERWPCGQLAAHDRCPLQ